MKITCPFCESYVEVNDSRTCPNCGGALGNEVREAEAKERERAEQEKQLRAQQEQQRQLYVERSMQQQNQYTQYRTTFVPQGRQCSKWVSFFLCFFFGYFGVHKFYEGKTGMGVLYIFTAGLFCIGWIVDLFAILFKSDPYYV